MSDTQHHVVRREFLDISVAGTEGDGLAAQRRIAGLCRDWLGPALDEVLARVVPPDEHWTFDRLEVDVGAFGLDTLERDFVRTVTDAIERQIRDRAGGRGGGISQRAPVGTTESVGAADRVLRRSGAEAVLDAFHYFLATGALPWWYRLPPDTTLEAALTLSWPSDAMPAAFAASVQHAIVATRARTRAMRQLSPAFLMRLLHRIAPDIATVAAAAWSITESEKLSGPRTQAVFEALWQAAFAAADGLSLAAAWRDFAPSPQGEGERALALRIANLLSSSSMGAVSTDDGSLQPHADASRGEGARLDGAVRQTRGKSNEAERTFRRTKRSETRPHERIDLDEGVFVESAGVVLLHPFLPRLFEGLGIAAGGKLAAPDRALAMLHFLATGERRAPEHALVLGKRLCGLPLEEPCGAPHPVSDAEAEEGNGLLAAVIGHWAALGGASTDALRGSFLVRRGKLGLRGDDEVLQVEEHAFDVLLDQLPWGLSPVRLPWMDKMLWVEWRM
ncbi:MAG TPA: contractile injection system tape measure protein [Rhizomicrobium sp.]|jgi:hypothetical protein|nr:contractile injection system tape measure protein [Rhizomicrobium sp.]